jgi:REP element-mobilizing transposase RayT
MTKKGQVRGRSRRGTRAKAGAQLELDWREWGGQRRGSGRRPRLVRAGVSHAVRQEFSRRCPVHVTLRVVEGVPSLRAGQLLVALHGCFERCEKDNFRVCHFSIQSNHIHLVVEADGREALSRGMQGLTTSIARTMNRELGRTGRFFADRYHTHVLSTPTEVRHALIYVLQNAKHHGQRYVGVDPFSSGWWFEHWRDFEPIENPPPIAPPQTWLLRTGWQRAGGSLRTTCRPA